MLTTSDTYEELLGLIKRLRVHKDIPALSNSARKMDEAADFLEDLAEFIKAHPTPIDFDAET